jgi:hypothetical protein
MMQDDDGGLVEAVRDALVRADCGLGQHVVVAFHQFTKGEQAKYNAMTDAVLSAIERSGFKVVPVEPTERMIAEGESAASFGIGKPTTDGAIKQVWDWMLSAAPKHG